MPLRGFGLPLTALTALALGPLAVAPAAAAPLPDRQISTTVVENGRNQLFLRGRVTPDYADRSVIVQKRNCLSDECDWFRHRVVRTNETGGFRSGITAPRKGSDYWRAKVEAQGDFGTSYSRIWRTWTS